MVVLLQVCGSARLFAPLLLVRRSPVLALSRLTQAASLRHISPSFEESLPTVGNLPATQPPPECDIALRRAYVADPLVATAS